MEYVIGVDAGGTATTASAYEWESGSALGTGTSGFGNPLNHYGMAMTHLEEAIRGAMAGLQGSCRFILAGVAGATAGGWNSQMAQTLSGMFGCPAQVETDARLALEGALKGGDGILLIAGTGSIAQGRRGKTMQLAGGWGNLVGDEGSGYDLVRRAIRLMTRDVDWGLPERPVCRAVREFFGMPDARAVVGWIQQHVKGEIAAASPVVEQAAYDGDPDAMRFLTEAGESLANLVIPLSRRLALPPGFPLALQGSLVRKVEPVRASLMDCLRKAGVAPMLLPPEKELTRGAWYYARAHARENG